MIRRAGIKIYCGVLSVRYVVSLPCKKVAERREDNFWALSLPVVVNSKVFVCAMAKRIGDGAMFGYR